MDPQETNVAENTINSDEILASTAFLEYARNSIGFRDVLNNPGASTAFGGAASTSTSPCSSAGIESGASTSSTCGDVKPTLESFIRRQRSPRSAQIRANSPKLCWGYIDGKLQAHPVGTCVQYRSARCLFEMRRSQFRTYSKRYPGIKKHSSTELRQQCQIDPVPRGAPRAAASVSDQDWVSLQQLMCGFQIDEPMGEEEDLARMVKSFKISDEAIGLEEGKEKVPLKVT
ncbi:hypothetical protein HHI36_010813 [Cryptolaemus montrouzieri]|uniref:Uncharacterized protein n=1 Tax=Cryptolaemus montrouzieri TaxID=559131 RepID=A0ABD2MK20_9CUCU